MNIQPEVWDVIKLGLAGYGVFLLNRSDRNQRELFKRIRAVELVCAAQHGVPGVHVHKRETDENS